MTSRVLGLILIQLNKIIHATCIKLLTVCMNIIEIVQQFLFVKKNNDFSILECSIRDCQKKR
jgi:hypothetical protein